MSLRGWIEWAAGQLANEIAGHINGALSSVILWVTWADGDLAATFQYWRSWLYSKTNHMPWPFNIASAWFVSLLDWYLLRPAHEFARAALNLPATLTWNTYNWSWREFNAAVYARILIYGIRDRLVDILSWAEDRIGDLYEWIEWLRSNVIDPLADSVGAAWGWIWALRDQIDFELWPEISRLWGWSDLSFEWIQQINDELAVIQSDPAGWIWSHLEPRIEGLARSWLIDHW